MQAQSSAGGGAAPSRAEAPAPKPKREAKSGKSHGVGFSTSFHEKVSVKVDWQGRSGRLCRATAPYKFVGVAKASGSARLEPTGVKTSGKAEASGKTTGGQRSGDCAPPRNPVPPTPKAEPVKTERKPARPEKPKPQSVTDKSEPKKPPQFGEDKSAPAKPKPKDEPPPKPPVGPTQEELQAPIEPPQEPPPNVFGYEKPVLGCFEGQVFPLKAEATKLPTSYDALTPVAVVYACEWDIAPRAWEQGFPGVADRFEWFAIRYGGAFRVADAGAYAFRISSDDGARVFIDGKQVLDNDGQHPPQEARGTIQLGAGDHQMVLEYFQGPRYHINLQLWVTPPGKPEELFTVR
jgi:PA14 domain